MEPNPQYTLEELIQRELAKLPERQAPEGLVTLVLARIQAQQSKHWWQRPWTQWPVGIRLASLPLLLASAGAAVFALSMLWNLAATNAQSGTVSQGLGKVSALWDVLSALGNAVLTIGRVAGQEWMLLASTLVPLTMYLTCVGVGTLCYRMAFSHATVRHE